MCRFPKFHFTTRNHKSALKRPVTTSRLACVRVRDDTDASNLARPALSRAV